MISLTKTSLLVASPDQVSADVSPDLSGDVVILHLKEGIYYELNETGARIWELIQQPCYLGTVLDTLLAEYEADAQQCEADLLALVEDMVARGLIEVKHGANS
jgi:Coenzyme PQQ synthesis protein D (PqqD)